jgi:hypothetical protein
VRGGDTMSLGCATTLRRALWLANVLGCLLTLTPVAAAAPAQAVHSEISGKLVDPQGVPVFGATVRAKGETNSAVREARTDEQGKFALSGLPPGHYLITAEAAAFVKLSLKIALGNGERRELQLAFQQLAEVTQSITVEGGAPTALARPGSGSVHGHRL